jgi:hypothetical protein
MSYWPPLLILLGHQAYLPSRLATSEVKSSEARKPAVTSQLQRYLL